MDLLFAYFKTHFFTDKNEAAKEMGKGDIRCADKVMAQCGKRKSTKKENVALRRQQRALHFINYKVPDQPFEVSTMVHWAMVERNSVIAAMHCLREFPNGRGV